MDKLKLEHLAPYLPYGLMVLHTTKEESTQLIVMGMHEDGGRTRYDGEGADNDPDFSIAVCRKPHHRYRPNGYFYIQKNFKPILRPLSDLTKQIEHNGERFVPIVELFKLRTQSTGSKIFDYYIENDTAILSLEGQQLDNLTFKCFFEVDLEPGQIMFSIASETWDDFGEGKLIDERIDMCGNEMTMLQKLYEWHFDVFGLIEKGLAISTDTLGKEVNREQ